MAALAIAALAGCEPQADRPVDTGIAEARRTVPLTTGSEEARRQYVVGRDLFDKLRFHEARKHFQFAVDADPNFAIAHYHLALSEATTKAFFDRLHRAMALAEQASEGERLIINALHASANADPAKALSYYEQLVTAYPNDAYAHFLLGFAVAGRQEFEKAIAEFTRATELDPDYSPAWNALGYAYRPLGRFDEAERAFKRYIQLIPKEPNPYDSYAELLLKTGRHEESIAMYRKALEADRHFVSAHVGIASNLMYQGRHAEAQVELERLLAGARDNGERRTARLAMAVAYLDEGKPGAAIEQLATRYALGERDGDAAAMAEDAALMGTVYLESGQPGRALGQYRRALKIVEGSALSEEIKADARLQHRAQIARVALKQGDTAGARRAADAFAESAGNAQNPARDREAQELVGLVALATGDYGGALTHLEQADRQDPYVLHAMARAYEGQGDAAKAREMYSIVATHNELPSLRYASVRRVARGLAGSR
ncbi:MAG TPA: tetratricopeptide repeat protein [Gemmatimonadales bacterium]|nr:tetratricopeptide repeat protein [Gemmatimonadales bacterium]